MLMTEKEAFEKRCPAPMGTMHDERTQNHCIGSHCMAWRWKPGGTVGKHVPGGYETTVTPAKTFGYCGLAGQVTA
jgi:hypothetical protein